MGRTADIARKIRKDALVFAVAALALLADQVSKILIRVYLPEQESVSLGLPVRLTHTTNNGAAFSFLQGQTVLFIVISIVVIGVILTYERFLPASGRLLKLSLGLQLGGALGNLIDRLLFAGKVTDFIDVGFWPIFNLADSSISVGVVILIFLLLFAEEGKNKPLQASHDDSQRVSG